MWTTRLRPKNDMKALFIYCHTDLSLAFCLRVPRVLLSHLSESI